MRKLQKVTKMGQNEKITPFLYFAEGAAYTGTPLIPTLLPGPDGAGISGVHCTIDFNSGHYYQEFYLLINPYLHIGQSQR